MKLKLFLLVFCLWASTELNAQCVTEAETTYWIHPHSGLPYEQINYWKHCPRIDSLVSSQKPLQPNVCDWWVVIDTTLVWYGNFALMNDSLIYKEDTLIFTDTLICFGRDSLCVRASKLKRIEEGK